MERHTLAEFGEMLEKEGLVSELSLAGRAAADVNYISMNSRDVQDGTLFVCKGAHFKDEYLAGALSGGAFAYVAERVFDAPIGTPYIIVSDIKRAMALMAGFYYGKTWDFVNIVGITGTKGKSTTTYMVKSVIDEYCAKTGKKRSAVVSGIDTYDGINEFESHLTTPESFDLFRHFDNAKKSGIEFLTMEVSSQALKYDRTYGVRFKVGCFMNIGKDHISGIEHENFEDYFSSKLRIFDQCETACVNIGSDHADEVLAAAEAAQCRVVTFGTKAGADYTAYDIVPSEEGISFKCKGPDFDTDFAIGMRGLFNIENAAATIAITRSLGIPIEYVKSGLFAARAAGRMEIFKAEKSKIYAIVDYAHNEMSFDALFNSVAEEFPGYEIAIVFGCPGKKAFDRRHDLGVISGKYADRVYLTEEDAGEEPVRQISEEIATHVRAQNHAECFIIDDREEAIRRAVYDANDKTVILLTGKGRETRQKRGIEYIDTPSDVELAEKFLKDR